MNDKHQILPLVEVRRLRKYFPLARSLFGKPIGYVRAVDDISFHINDGETLGLVGESGSGKTTVGRLLTRLTKPTEGEVLLRGRDIARLRRRELKPFRRQIQMIFQDPYASLNPRMSAGELVAEPFYLHQLRPRDEIREYVAELFKQVGLSPEQMMRYPHQFSGGQRQRLGVARALALSPRLIIADEPVSALDVSIQAQVINLLTDLQAELGLSYLFISHDISIVAHVSHRIAVMYLGKLVETAEKTVLLNSPLHPYTISLLNAVPIANPKLRKKRHKVATGDVPSIIKFTSGCRFHTRCPSASDKCENQEPTMLEVEPHHFVACHYPK